MPDRQCRMQAAHSTPQLTLDPIPRDGATDALADDEAIAIMRQSVGRAIQVDKAMPPRPPLHAQPLEIQPMSQP